MQTKVETIINGVDVSRLAETVEAVKASPELGGFKFRIQNRWIDCGENRSQVSTFFAGGQEAQHESAFTLVADEPEILLGGDRGANPVEHLLHALASCVTTSMVYHAAARGITLEQVESTLEGNLDLRGFLDLSTNVRKGYQNIRVTVRIKADVPDETIRELGSLGPRFSPVYDTLTRGVPITVSAERLR
jgi:uncharacterized OsmC-like protein